MANWLLLEYRRVRVNTSSKVIYIVSMVIFVIAHFFLLEMVRFEYWPLYSLYGIHMVISAYFLARIRMKRNTLYSMILHCLYNLVPALVLVF